MSFKIHFRFGNPPHCSGVISVQVGQNARHSLKPRLPPSQDGVIGRENVYSKHFSEHDFYIIKTSLFVQK